MKKKTQIRFNEWFDAFWTQFNETNFISFHFSLSQLKTESKQSDNLDPFQTSNALPNEMEYEKSMGAVKSKLGYLYLSIDF